MSKATLSYSLMQGTEWALDACLYCYSSVFLLSCGLNNTFIGILLAVAACFSFFGQIFFGEFLNKRGNRALKYFLLLGGGVLFLDSILLLFGLPRFPAVVLFILSCLYLQLLPAFLNSAAMYKIQMGISIKYGVGRGFGSLGYALTSAFVGQLIPHFGIPIIFCFGILLSLIFIFSVQWFFITTRHSDDKNISLSPKPNSKQSHSFDLGFLTRYPNYAILLVGIVILMTGHTYMSNFLYQILAFKGGNEATVGVASALAACAEFPVLFLFDKISHWLRCDLWLKLSCILLTFKLLLAFFADTLLLLQISELLQMGYALFVASSVYYTGQIISGEDAISSQAYLNAASTLGVLLSLLSGGFLIDQFGVPVLLLTGVFSLSTGTLIIFHSIHQKNKTA